MIKRLDRFVLRSFLPVMLMTFVICEFIVMMQFLWRYIDDLVGKGLGIGVIGELFFYAALTMVPMALPLAILLASLMTFGNLGERFELTAMKSSGISLLRVMASLIILISAIAVGAFYFQNNVLPIAQTKMWTLLYSMRQKAPELEIPEGVFYDQIPGYNLFVADKNQSSGMLHGLMIYDMSRGFENSSIILADSGKLAITPDREHLYLKLWQGESFENLKDATNTMTNVPYRRETFDTKDVLIKFDSEFNRLDEQGMRSQYVGKNIAELQQTIDSVSAHADSIGLAIGQGLKETPFMNLPYYETEYVRGEYTRHPRREVEITHRVNMDSILSPPEAPKALSIYSTALSRLDMRKQDFEFKSFQQADDDKTIRRHGIEMHKKFTLSLACLIFFFIGAPLGAIIRKGGLGMPLVISVFLFIFYYIIDNTGYKLARDGRWEVWQGMWLSAAVLLPLGIWVTYKAVNDAAVFNPDAYRAFLRNITGRREKRHIAAKELVMENVIPEKAHIFMEAVTTACNKWLENSNKENLEQIREKLEPAIVYLSNSTNPHVIAKLNTLPVLRRGFWVWLRMKIAKPRIRKEIINIKDTFGDIEHLISPEGADHKDNQQ